jgi:hypothetical protein
LKYKFRLQNFRVKIDSILKIIEKAESTGQRGEVGGGVVTDSQNQTTESFGQQQQSGISQKKARPSRRDDPAGGRVLYEVGQAQASAAPMFTEEDKPGYFKEV